MNPIKRSDVTCGLLSRLIGGLGIVTTIAPFPGLDMADSPHVFEADSFAKILSPRAQLYGAAWSTRSGTVQV